MIRTKIKKNKKFYSIDALWEYRFFFSSSPYKTSKIPAKKHENEMSENRFSQFACVLWLNESNLLN